LARADAKSRHAEIQMLDGANCRLRGVKKSLQAVGDLDVSALGDVKVLRVGENGVCPVRAGAERLVLEARTE